MYTHQDEREVEKICYEEEHVEKVLNLIRKNFDKYFKNFIEDEAGISISKKDAEKIGGNLGIRITQKDKLKDITKKFKTIIKEAIEDFEKDREKYEDILNEEVLEEYEEDSSTFKSIALKNECPIIHSTYYNKAAKELDKYRYEFNISNSEDLLTVVTNLYYFAEDYKNEFYNANTYDEINKYWDLEISDLDTDDYTVYGVIGGGIKSHMLYKLYPGLFPNRSRDSIWSLWYLTEKDVIDCEKDSEFLMIDINKYITQQNYFYPYELFIFYAHQIYQMLKKKAEELNIGFDDDYRYVYVDSFFKFIAKQHQEEINTLKSQIKDGGHSYA